MNHRNLVLKSVAPFYSRQLLNIHLHPVSAYRQMGHLLFSFSLGQLCLLQNLQYSAPVSKRIFFSQFMGDADRAMARILLPIGKHGLPVGFSDYRRQLMRSTRKVIGTFLLEPLTHSLST